MTQKILSLAELTEISLNLKSKGKKIVATSGCFDLLHAGHAAYLSKAKRKGDFLVVMLNSDSSVRALKGSGRPIVTQNDRAFLISALECVDYVCIFDEETPCGCYAAFKPDIVVKGGDYRGKIIPEMTAVSEYGGKVECVDFVDGCSTTAIIKKIEEVFLEMKK